MAAALMAFTPQDDVWFAIGRLGDDNQQTFDARDIIDNQRSHHFTTTPPTLFPNRILRRPRLLNCQL